MQAFCVTNSCIKKTNFKALVDSGTSFTFVPQEVYEIVSEEVHELAFELTPACLSLNLLQIITGVPSITISSCSLTSG